MLDIEGIHRAPDYAPGKVLPFPFVVCFPDTGVFKWTSYQFTTGKHNIALELHWAGFKDVPRDIEKALPFLERIAKALWNDPTLAGSDEGAINAGVIDANEKIEYQFGPLNYFGEQTYGWKFTFVVKSQGATNQ
jgi:hypothetical protein